MVGFGELNHSGKTLGIEPVVGVNHFAVFTGRRHLLKSNIVVLHHANKRRIVVDADPGVPVGIFLSNWQRPIVAAVVNDDILPIGIGLRQNTFDALGQILLAVVDRRQDTNQRLVL